MLNDVEILKKLSAKKKAEEDEKLAKIKAEELAYENAMVKFREREEQIRSLLNIVNGIYDIGYGQQFERFDHGNLVANGCTHKLAFTTMTGGCRHSRTATLRIARLAGGACGHWDLFVECDSIRLISDENGEVKKPTSEDILRTLSGLDTLSDNLDRFVKTIIG